MQKQLLQARVYALGIGLALVTLSSAAPYAQTLTPVNQNPATTPGWVFTPSIGFGGVWDDNVLVVSEAQGPPSDYASPIRPSATLTFTGKRTRFSTGYDGSVTLYRTLEELTSFQQHLRVGLSHRPTERVTLFVDESFTMAPTTDAVPLNGGVPFHRIGTRTNALGGGFEAALQRHLSARGEYTLRMVDFDFDEIAGRQLQGGYSHEFDFSVNRAVSPRFTIGGEYGLDRVTITTDPRTNVIAEEPFNIMNARATLNYVLSPAVSLSGGLGIAHLGAGPTHESQTAPAWRAGIVYRMEHMVLSGAHSRSYVPSFGFGGTLQNEEWSGRASVPFARNRAYADLSVAWYNNESLEPGQPRLRSVWVGSRVGYRATRWLSVEGFYARSDQNTRRVGGQLSRNQIGFQVVTTRALKIH